MQIELINQSYQEGLEEFKLKSFKRKWNILTMVVEGEYAITFKETQKTLVLRKNEIALVPAEMEVERSVRAALTYYHIAFYAQADHPFYLAAAPGKLNIPREQVDGIFATMKRAFLLPDNRELITHTVERVFVEHYLSGNGAGAHFRPLSEEVESAIRYMRSNFDKKIDMDELAEQVFLSHSGLIWKFKRELNTTPSNYLSILRLRHAKHLLLNYSYSITEISERCGYSTPFYFANAFCRYAGMSPTAFRKHHLKEEALPQEKSNETYKNKEL